MCENAGLSSRLHRINQQIAETDFLYHQAALKLGLTDSALRVLYTLLDHGCSCPLALVYRQTGLSKQTVHSAIRKLEEQGILTLQAENGGAKTAALTKAGQEYTKNTAGRLFQAECRVYADWSEEEMQQMLSLMQKYNTALQKQIDTM